MIRASARLLQLWGFKKMTYAARWMKAGRAAVSAMTLTALLFGFAMQARAAELPLAAASPMTGVAFDDRPLLLPVQRNFQMAMLTASSELGRSCGKMEAYGWRMGQAEQGRVNQIFNNTVDRLRLLGYSIAPQTLTSVSTDITLFTADHANKHFLFLWSAGELGLVLNLCETSAPLKSAYRASNLVPSVQVFSPQMDDVVSGHLEAARKYSGNFSPMGDWVGGYTCAQGYTGGTLQISEIHGKNFNGVFKFYPTPKNRSVPVGSYYVYGQYDAESNRILINPGAWIQRPKSFYNTVLVGGFDPVKDSFSAYFQGVSGCTSFEATHVENGKSVPAPTHKPKKHDVKKKKAVKKSVVKAAPVASDLAVSAPVVSTPAIPPAPAPLDDKKDAGIVLTPPPVVPAAPASAPVPAAVAK